MLKDLLVQYRFLITEFYEIEQIVQTT